jgi:hypothetical protein
MFTVAAPITRRFMTATPHGTKSLGRDRDYAAAFGIAPGDFNVSERQENETTGGEQNKKRVASWTWP